MILRLDSTDDLHLAFTSHLNTPLFVRSFSTMNFKQILRSPFISHYQSIESVLTGKNLKKREKWSNNIQYNVQWLVKVFEYLPCKTFTNRSCVLCHAYVYIVYVYIFFIIYVSIRVCSCHHVKVIQTFLLIFDEIYILIMKLRTNYFCRDICNYRILQRCFVSILKFLSYNLD